MDRIAHTIFPAIDSSYLEEFGYIDLEVYAAAREQWAQAERLAVELLNDAHEGLRLMLKAVASVSQVRSKEPGAIKNLPAYLFFSYKRLLLANLEKENGHRTKLNEWEAAINASETDDQTLNRRILLNEIKLQMDDWTREVFELQCLGYKYEELVPEYGSAANVIRSRYSKNISRLAEKVKNRINRSLVMLIQNLLKGAFLF
ncbi:MAG: hypothetical protein M3384_10695 [Acidobacteriota bacterium]|nr:hypothetical protein [Acidobacteriota bacterium]